MPGRTVIAPVVERWIELVKDVLGSGARAGVMTARDAADLLRRAEHPPDGAPTDARRLLAVLADVAVNLPVGETYAALRVEIREAGAIIRRERDDLAPANRARVLTGAETRS